MSSVHVVVNGCWRREERERERESPVGCYVVERAQTPAAQCALSLEAQIQWELRLTIRRSESGLANHQRAHTSALLSRARKNTATSALFKQQPANQPPRRPNKPHEQSRLNRSNNNCLPSRPLIARFTTAIRRDSPVCASYKPVRYLIRQFGPHRCSLRAVSFRAEGGMKGAPAMKDRPQRANTAAITAAR